MGYVFVIGVIEIIFSAKDSFCRILNNTSTLIFFSPFIKFNPRSKINSPRFLLAFWIVTPKLPIFVFTNSVCNPAASNSSSIGALPLSEAMYKTLVGLVYISIQKNLLSLAVSNLNANRVFPDPLSPQCTFTSFAIAKPHKAQSIPVPVNRTFLLFVVWL